MRSSTAPKYSAALAFALCALPLTQGCQLPGASNAATGYSSKLLAQRIQAQNQMLLASEQARLKEQLALQALLAKLEKQTTRTESAARSKSTSDSADIPLVLPTSKVREESYPKAVAVAKTSAPTQTPSAPSKKASKPKPAVAAAPSLTEEEVQLLNKHAGAQVDAAAQAVDDALATVSTTLPSGVTVAPDPSTGAMLVGLVKGVGNLGWKATSVGPTLEGLSVAGDWWKEKYEENKAQRAKAAHHKARWEAARKKVDAREARKEKKNKEEAARKRREKNEQDFQMLKDKTQGVWARGRELFGLDQDS